MNALYEVHDQQNIITDRQKLIGKYHTDLKLNFVLNIRYKEDNETRITSIVYFKNQWSNSPCISLRLKKNGTVTSTTKSNLQGVTIYSEIDIKRFAKGNHVIFYSEPDSSGDQDLSSIDHIFKNPKKVEIDRGRSRTSKIVDKLVKSVFVFVFTGIIVGASFMAKYYLIQILKLREFPPASSDDQIIDESANYGLEWAIFTLTASTEVLTGFYTLLVWLFSVDINPQSFHKIFSDYWRIIISDCFSAAAEVILILVVYPSVDSLTLLSVMSSCLMTPLLVLVYETVLVQHAKPMHQACDGAGLAFTFLVYVLTITNYCLNCVKIDSFVVISIVILPWLVNIKFWWTWLSGETISKLFKSEPEECRHKLSVCASIFRILTIIVVGLPIVYCWDSPIDAYGFDYGKYWHYLVLVILGGFIVSYFSYVSSKICAQRIPLGIGCLFGWLSSLIYVSCTTDLLYPDPSLPNWLFATLIGLFTSVAWVLSFRHMPTSLNEPPTFFNLFLFFRLWLLLKLVAFFRTL